MPESIFKIKLQARPANKEHFRTTASVYQTFPVNTGLKLNVHKTFRRCPERLLNVLCAFNLRPVSTGLSTILKTLTYSRLFKRKTVKVILSTIRNLLLENEYIHVVKNTL